MEYTPNYDLFHGIETEAGRRGLSTCLNCGAAVILGDKDVDAQKVHDDWHRSL